MMIARRQPNNTATHAAAIESGIKSVHIAVVVDAAKMPAIMALRRCARLRSFILSMVFQYFFIIVWVRKLIDC